MRTFGWVFRGCVLALLLLVVGCAASMAGRSGVDESESATEPAAAETVPEEIPDPAGTAQLNAPVVVTTAPPVTIPAGFTAFDAFGYRGLQTCPPATPRCVGIEIYSSKDCPLGANVVLEYFKEASHPMTYLGVARGVSPAIQSGTSQQIFIGTPAELRDSDPYGYIEAIDC